MTSRLDMVVETIKEELGYPVIDLYITDEQIITMVNKSIRKCSDKVAKTFLANKSVAGGKVDVSDLDVDVVKHIYMSHDSERGDNIFDYMSVLHHPGSGNYLDILTRMGEASELKKLAFYDYYLDGDTLYVDNYKGNITLEYLKKNLTLDDLDNTWLSWVEEYASAKAKIIEGRIRGKFRPQNAPFETDASELVSEGESAKQELESKLDMAPGYYNVMR